MLTNVDIFFGKGERKIARKAEGMPVKSLIYHHRAYRKLPKVHPWNTALEFFMCAVILNLIILFIYPSITYFISYIGKIIFSNSIEQYEILNSPFILGDVYILDIFGRYPSLTFSIYSALSSMVLIILMPLLKFINKPISIWLTLIFLINLISSLFFIFFSDFFPYSMWIYLDLYIKTEICIWLIIPYLLIFAFLPLPANFFSKLKLVVVSLIYSIIFGSIRYIVFIFILREYSYIFMAVVFFIFGPFFNFIYIISFYSLFVSRLAVKLKGDVNKWGWLF